MEKFRQHLSAPGLVSLARSACDKVKDWRPDSSRVDFTLSDSLMSGLAIFGMKFPSLLQFNDGARGDPIIQGNLRNLYGIGKVPSDTRLREILDPLDPNSLRPAFKAVFAKIQDGKALQAFRYLDNSYLISIDGTGFFSSNKVSCENCCTKTSRNGAITYYHQMLSAVVVHPDQKQVLPVAPEAIVKQDGSRKNDCEQNAAKRLIAGLRRDHPNLKVRILGDGLFSKAPMVKLARQHDMGFIFGAKPGDHKSLFDYLEAGLEIGAATSSEVVIGSVTHSFKFINDVPINDANEEVKINLLKYSETKNGKTTTFSWITDIFLNKDNVFQVMKGGRARWKIENETFNTLKNQGYQFEHNFGHGHKNLSTIFAYLMLLAFLIDQAQELSCPVVKELFAKLWRRSYVWEKLRAAFLTLIAESWEMLYHSLIYGAKPNPNTS